MADLFDVHVMISDLELPFTDSSWSELSSDIRAQLLSKAQQLLAISSNESTVLRGNDGDDLPGAGEQSEARLASSTVI